MKRRCPATWNAGSGPFWAIEINNLVRDLQQLRDLGKREDLVLHGATARAVHQIGIPPPEPSRVTPTLSGPRNGYLDRENCIEFGG